MLPAFIFLVAAYVPGQIKAKLKHPFLVAIKTWALAHLIANGDLASIILFGSFLAYAVYDRITLKRRQATGLVTVPPDRPTAQRSHRRGARRRALRGVPGLAAPAPDRDGAVAALENQAPSGPFFALQNFLYFCHKTEGIGPDRGLKEPSRSVAGIRREAGDRAGYPQPQRRARRSSRSPPITRIPRASSTRMSTCCWSAIPSAW